MQKYVFKLMTSYTYYPAVKYCALHAELTARLIKQLFSFCNLSTWTVFFSLWVIAPPDTCSRGSGVRWCRNTSRAQLMRIHTAPSCRSSSGLLTSHLTGGVGLKTHSVSVRVQKASRDSTESETQGGKVRKTADEGRGVLSEQRQWDEEGGGGGGGRLRMSQRPDLSPSVVAAWLWGREGFREEERRQSCRRCRDDWEQIIFVASFCRTLLLLMRTMKMMFNRRLRLLTF